MRNCFSFNTLTIKAVWCCQTVLPALVNTTTLYFYNKDKVFIYVLTVIVVTVNFKLKQLFTHSPDR